jgi:hypothetical protein
MNGDDKESVSEAFLAGKLSMGQVNFYTYICMYSYLGLWDLFMYTITWCQMKERNRSNLAMFVFYITLYACRQAFNYASLSPRAMYVIGMKTNL